MFSQLYTLWALDNAMQNLDMAQDIINIGRDIESDDVELQLMLDQEQTNLNRRREDLLIRYYEIASSN